MNESQLGVLTHMNFSIFTIFFFESYNDAGKEKIGWKSGGSYTDQIRTKLKIIESKGLAEIQKVISPSSLSYSTYIVKNETQPLKK